MPKSLHFRRASFLYNCKYFKERFFGPSDLRMTQKSHPEGVSPKGLIPYPLSNIKVNLNFLRLHIVSLKFKKGNADPSQFLHSSVIIFFT